MKNLNTVIPNFVSSSEAVSYGVKKVIERLCDTYSYSLVKLMQTVVYMYVAFCKNC